MADEIARLEEQIHDLRKRLAEARRSAPHEPVKDYTFQATDSSQVSLAELFGDKKDLILIHNMGRSCPYCTLWADGFNGVARHLENRAAFVVASPDAPKTQQEFAAGRGWTFRMVSYAGGPFAKDMGFERQPGKFGPGVSAYRRNEDGSIVRAGKASFGPGDDFCAVWHLFDLLAAGPGDWAPKYTY